MDLSGVWAFKLDDGRGFEEKWYERPLESAMTMPVPASYNDLKEGEAFRDHYGWCFYQRTLAVPSYMTGQRLVLRFAAVTHIAKVYLNGELIAEHKGGFLPFEVQINEYLREGENLLTVAVDNRIDHTTLPVGSEAGGGMGDLMGDRGRRNREDRRIHEGRQTGGGSGRNRRYPGDFRCCPVAAALRLFI